MALNSLHRLKHLLNTQPIRILQILTQKIHISALRLKRYLLFSYRTFFLISNKTSHYNRPQSQLRYHLKFHRTNHQNKTTKEKGIEPEKEERNSTIIETPTKTPPLPPSTPSTIRFNNTSIFSSPLRKSKDHLSQETLVSTPGRNVDLKVTPPKVFLRKPPIKLPHLHTLHRVNVQMRLSTTPLIHLNQLWLNPLAKL